MSPSPNALDLREGEALLVGYLKGFQAGLAHADNKRRGKHARQGPPPYGFKRGAGGRLSAERSEREVIRYLREGRARGLTWAHLCAVLNREGSTTRSGRLWATSAAWRALESAKKSGI